jgi:hypothetical protein
MNKSATETLSLLLSPIAFEIYAVILFSLFSPIGPGILGIAASMGIGLLFVALIPLLIVYVFSKGRFEMFKKEERNEPYPLVILSFLAAASIFWILGSHLMFILSFAYAVVTTTCFFINLFWKISTHSAGVAGPLTAVVLIFGLQFSPLFLLLVPVFWVRLKLRAHTPLQLIGGVIVASSLTFIIYSNMWLT